MVAILEDPEIRARVLPISVEAYHHFFELGEISEKTELIRGTVVEKTPKTPLHSSIVGLIRALVLPHLPAGYITRQEQPLTFGDSEPEPDLAIVQGQPSDFFTAHPETAALVIEVSVSSERLDRIKLGIYAEARVPECWIILAEKRVIERHTEPVGSAGYAKCEFATAPELLESSVFPGLHLPPPELWPR